MTQILQFTNGYLADNRQLIKKDLFVDVISGVIIEKPTENLENLEIEIIDLNGQIISSGFIDIQINGCFGLDYSCIFNDDENSKSEFVKNYNQSMEKLLQYGVTSICPTVTSSFPDVYRDVLMILGLKTRSTNKTDSLGVHIEGPFISPQKKGCHPPETLTTIKNGYSSLIARYGDDFEKYTAILTAAPEVEGVLSTIDKIVNKSDIIFSIGHTMSDFDMGVNAINQGASMLTHLYNAMPPSSARNPGITGLINATIDKVPESKLPFYGLVADGIHVHPSLIKASYMANPNRAILVTDAMSLIGLKDGIYNRGNQEIEKKDKLLHLKGTEIIAGSATHLLDCVHNLIKWTGIPIEEALATITNNPSTSLKLSKRKGFLNTGCDADLNILTVDGKLVKVYKLGQKVLG
jgi:N-acetylglucosamine-6-phosphate deacetylase